MKDAPLVERRAKVVPTCSTPLVGWQSEAECHQKGPWPGPVDVQLGTRRKSRPAWRKVFLNCSNVFLTCYSLVILHMKTVKFWWKLIFQLPVWQGLVYFGECFAE